MTYPHSVVRRSTPTAFTGLLITGLLITGFMSAILSSSSVASAQSLQADQLFDSSKLVNIEIELPAESWQELRKQKRGSGGFAAIFSNPTEKPFSYFEADITINGEKISSVGIRKKGFIGSLDDDRPSLKVKFHEFVAQSPVEGLDRLTLNNNKQDTSLLSQFLAYRVFNKAGVYAPRVSLAKVTVNGEYLGIYSNVETYKQPFLEARFGNSSGNLYEGTIADFHPKVVEKMEAKSIGMPSEFRDLDRLTDLLAAEAELPLDKVAKLVNVDNFLKFWAVESLLGFWDGYSQNQNNFFVYDNPADNQFYFMPWGADACFTDGGGPFARFSGSKNNASVRAEAMLANRLFRSEGISARYKQTMLEVLATAWNEEELLAEVDRMEELIREELHPNQEADKNPSPWGLPWHTRDGVRKFIRTRRAQVLAELEKWPIEVAAEPRKPMYTVQVGSATGSLATHWAANSNSSDPGELTDLALELSGGKIQLKNVKVVAQPMPFFGFGGPSNDPDAKPPASIIVNGEQESNGEPATITLIVDHQLISKQQDQPVDVSGFLSIGKRSGFGFGSQGQMISGKLRLSQTGTDDGDTIAGDFELNFIEMHGGMMDRRRGRDRSARPN